VELDIIVFPEIITDLVEVGGENKKAFCILRRPSITVVLHFTASCWLVPLNNSSISISQFLPSLIFSIGAFDPLNLVKEKTFAFNDIIHYLYITQHPSSKLNCISLAGTPMPNAPGKQIRQLALIKVLLPAIFAPVKKRKFLSGDISIS
jgi:hypothetical protein